MSHDGAKDSSAKLFLERVEESNFNIKYLNIEWNEKQQGCYFIIQCVSGCVCGCGGFVGVGVCGCGCLIKSHQYFFMPLLL